MRYKILRLIALLLLLVNLSSCFEGRWGRYKNRHHYILKHNKKRYQRLHNRGNGDW